MNFPYIPFFNTITFVLSVLVNYLINAGLVFNGKSVGQVSEKYDSFFTPADYAFSIWGFIYFYLFVFIIFQWYSWFKKQESFELTGLWFILINLANGLWVYFWVKEYTGLSVLVMLFLLWSLIQLILKLNMEKWDAPLRIIAFVWWPFAFYLGWIILATVANISAYLISIGYNGYPFTQAAWTVIMIIIATCIYVFLTFNRNLREPSLVGVWGLIAIAYKHWGAHPEIVYAALGCGLVLLLSSAYHGFKNMETSPLKKWKRGEV